MPPVRRQNIGRRTRNASRNHNLPDNETEEDHRQRSGWMPDNATASVFTNRN